MKLRLHWLLSTEVACEEYSELQVALEGFKCSYSTDRGFLAQPISRGYLGTTSTYLPPTSSNDEPLTYSGRETSAPEAGH